MFQTHLYIGAGGTTVTVDNGIDLLNKGGLVWIKARNATEDHGLFDTTRGVTKLLSSNNTNAEATNSGTLTNFYDNGFKVDGNGIVGSSTDPYVSWTFRKQPKFFDVVTYTGTGSARTVSHNLGSVPGMIIVKGTDSTDDWVVYHRSMDSSAPEDYRMIMNDTTARVNAPRWNDTAPTATQFSVDSDTSVNGNGSNYVAYLFAHNNNDGGFGEPGDQDIIKCAGYTSDGGTGTEINVGFEPQFLMIKRSSGTGDWMVFDAMRGVVNSAYPNLDNTLFWNLNNVERTNTGYIGFTPTGFIHQGASGDTNTNGETYVYMAIRRGGMQTPTTASNVFAIATRSSSDGEGKYTSGFPVDFSLAKVYDETGNTFAGTRLLNAHLQTNDNVTAGTSASDYEWDHNDGVSIGASGAFFGSSKNIINWMWKRARGFFDVVVYEGPSTTGNISHNLGVVPEMIWVKNTGATENWAVYHKDLGNTYYLHLNTTAAASNTDGGNFWNSTTPTASVFSVGTSTLTSHYTRKHVAYLFASIAGVCKVGSYTGNSSSTQDIDCGFTNGAKNGDIETNISCRKLGNI